MDTVGNDLTDLPLVAAIVVAAVASTIVTFLSALGIPASFVIIATMSIVGLGWGRATRTTSLSDTVQGEAPVASVGALTTDADAADAPTVGGKKGTPKPAETEPIGEDRARTPVGVGPVRARHDCQSDIPPERRPLDCDARGVSVFRILPIA